MGCPFPSPCSRSRCRLWLSQCSWCSLLRESWKTRVLVAAPTRVGALPLQQPCMRCRSTVRVASYELPILDDWSYGSLDASFCLRPCIAHQSSSSDVSRSSDTPRGKAILYLRCAISVATADRCSSGTTVVRRNLRSHSAADGVAQRFLVRHRAHQRSRRDVVVQAAVEESRWNRLPCRCAGGLVERRRDDRRCVAAINFASLAGTSAQNCAWNLSCSMYSSWLPSASIPGGATVGPKRYVNPQGLASARKVSHLSKLRARQMDSSQSDQSGMRPSQARWRLRMWQPSASTPSVPVDGEHREPVLL